MKNYSGDVILDDRMGHTIGKKVMEAKRVGYPLIVIVGKKSVDPIPILELHDLNRNTQQLLTVDQLFGYLKEYM